MLTLKNYVSITSLHILNLKRDQEYAERYSLLPAAIFMTVIMPFITLSFLRFDYSEGTDTAEEIFSFIFIFQLLFNILAYVKEKDRAIDQLAHLPMSAAELCMTTIVIRLRSPLNWPIIISLLMTDIYIAGSSLHFFLMLLFSIALFLLITLLMHLLLLVFDSYSTWIKKFLSKVVLPLLFLFCVVFSYKWRNSTVEFAVPLLDGPTRLLDPAIFIWTDFPVLNYLITMAALLLLIVLQFILCKRITIRSVWK